MALEILRETPYIITKYRVVVNIHGSFLSMLFIDKEPTEADIINNIVSKVAKVDKDWSNGDLLFYSPSTTHSYVLSFWFYIPKDNIPNIDIELGEYEIAQKTMRLILETPSKVVNNEN